MTAAPRLLQRDPRRVSTQWQSRPGCGTGAVDRPGRGVELVLLLVVEAGSWEEVDLEGDLGRPEVLRGTVGPRRGVSPSPSIRSLLGMKDVRKKTEVSGILQLGKGVTSQPITFRQRRHLGGVTSTKMFPLTESDKLCSRKFDFRASLGNVWVFVKLIFCPHWRVN